MRALSAVTRKRQLHMYVCMYVCPYVFRDQLNNPLLAHILGIDAIDAFWETQDVFTL